MINYLPIPEKKELLSIRDSFIDELHRAAAGKQSSLSYLTHPLPTQPLVPDGASFQVISIGGTVCKSALVRKDKSEISMNQIQSSNLPIFNTAEILYTFILSLLSKDSSFLALNFAYPLDACIRDGKIDGRLIRGSKEHVFAGLIGKTVGQEIEEYIYKTASRHVEVTVANDTVCLVLSGLTLGKWNETAAYVIGTGTNIGFFADEHTIVNLESANFDKFNLADVAREIDKRSSAPGTALFEKEVSGAYIFQSFNTLIKKHFPSVSPITSSIELYDIAVTQAHHAAPLAQQIFRRSAFLLAAQMAGLYLYRSFPTLTLVIEGSVFWKNDFYQKEVGKALELLNIPTGSIQFRSVENSELLGPSYLLGI